MGQASGFIAGAEVMTASQELLQIPLSASCIKRHIFRKWIFYTFSFSRGETFILVHLHFCHQSNLHFYSIINEHKSHLHFLVPFSRTGLEHIWCTGTCIQLCVGVLLSTRETCKDKTKQLGDCFNAVKYTVTIKQRQNDEGFQVQIEAKAPLPSAGAHIKHEEAVRWRKLYHWSKRKWLAQVAFVFSTLQRWNSIIHHNLASGQWFNSVNSLVGLLMRTLTGSC